MVAVAVSVVVSVVVTVLASLTLTVIVTVSISILSLTYSPSLLTSQALMVHTHIYIPIILFCQYEGPRVRERQLDRLLLLALGNQDWQGGNVHGQVEIRREREENK